MLHDASAEPKICHRVSFSWFFEGDRWANVTAFDDFFTGRRRVIDSQYEYVGDKRLEERYRQRPGLPRFVEANVILRYDYEEYLHNGANDAAFSMDLICDLIQQALNPI